MGEITSSSVRSYDASCQLMMADVAIDDGQNPTVVRIHLKRTKTTPFSGVDVFLGRTDDDLCPVSALLAYLAVRGVAPGPLFRFQDGRFLTKQLFIERVRMGLDTLGLSSSDYAGHSFRIGAATTAAERGVEDSLIKMLGRWESSAYQIYIKTPRDVYPVRQSRLSQTCQLLNHFCRLFLVHMLFNISVLVPLGVALVRDILGRAVRRWDDLEGGFASVDGSGIQDPTSSTLQVGRWNSPA